MHARLARLVNPAVTAWPLAIVLARTKRSSLERAAKVADATIMTMGH